MLALVDESNEEASIFRRGLAQESAIANCMACALSTAENSKLQLGSVCIGTVGHNRTSYRAAAGMRATLFLEGEIYLVIGCSTGPSRAFSVAGQNGYPEAIHATAGEADSSLARLVRSFVNLMNLMEVSPTPDEMQRTKGTCKPISGARNNMVVVPFYGWRLISMAKRTERDPDLRARALSLARFAA